MKKLFLLCFISISSFLYAQEQNFSPFPSKIKTYKNGVEIIITWKDTDDLDEETYLIYRSQQPITEETADQAVFLAEIDEGIMIYTDRPDRSGDFYYAIICKSKDQQVYPIYLPYRNSLARITSVESDDFEEEYAGQVENLKATVLDNQVSLQFKLSNPDRSYGVYRSTEMIDTKEMLDKAVLLRILEDGRNYYLDTPIPGIEYYYAVVDFQLFQNSGENRFIFQGNYTDSAVKLPITQYMGNDYQIIGQRRAPLPEIRLERFYTEIAVAPQMELPLNQPLNKRLEERIQRRFALPDSQNDLFIETSVLPLELAESDQRIEQDLQAIVISGSFYEKQWDTAARELEKLLSKAEDRVLSARIFYYLGQCHYFSEDIEKAFLDFSVAETYYPLKSKTWLENLINRL